MKPALKTFSKNVFSQVAVQILLATRALVILPILVKTLGEFYYGIWAQLIITITLLASVFTLRFDIVFVRFFSSEKSKPKLAKAYSSMLFAILLILTAISLVFFSFRDEIAFFVFSNTAFGQYALILLALLSLRTMFIFSLSYYRSRHEIVLYSSIQCIQILGEIGVLFTTVILFDQSLLGALNVLIAFNAGIAFISVISVFYRLGFSIPDLKFLKPFMLFSLPLIPNVSLQWIVNFSNRYVITHLIDLESVGIYSASFALGRFVSFFIAPLAFVLYPTISKLWEEGNLDEIKYWMSNSLKLFLIFAIPAVLGIHYFAPYVLTKLASEQFAQHRWLALLIGSGFLFLGIYQVYLYLMHLKEKTLAVLIIFIIVAVLNLALNFLFVPMMGIEGAALGTLISYVVQTSLVYFIANKGFRVSLPVKFIFKALLSGGLMIIFLMFVSPGNWLTNLGLALAGGGVYFMSMFITGAVGKKEIKALRKILPI